MKCDKCFLCSKYNPEYTVNTNCIPGFGSLDSSTLIILDAPDKTEDEYGRPAVGKPARKLKEALARVGLKIEDVRVTYACRCRPYKSEDITTAAIMACREHLEAEIRIMPNLKLIVPMGNVPLFALTNKPGTKRKPQGISTQRGKLQFLEEFNNVAMLPTRSPSDVLRNPKYQSVFFDDFQRAATYLSGGMDKSPVNYFNVYTLEDLYIFLNTLPTIDLAAFDLETTSKDTPFGTRILNISFSWKSKTAVYLPINEGDTGNYWVNHYGEETWRKLYNCLKDWFENPAIFKIAHNMKYDISYLEAILGIRCKGIHFCTMLAHYLLDNLTDHDLKSLADRYTDLGNYEDILDEAFKKVKADKSIPKEKKHYGSIPVDIMRQYAATDSDAAFRLYKILKTSIDNSVSKNVFYSILMPLVRVIADMELHGVGVDVELARSLSKELQDKKDIIANEVNTLAGREINIMSTDQLKVLFFTPTDEGGLGLTPLKLTAKGNISVDEKVLKIMAENYDLPILNKIVEYRSLSTIQSTFVDAMIEGINPITNRLHQNLLMHRTTTGRLAGKKPNLLNIPRDSEDSGKIRNIFIPIQRPGTTRRRVYVDGDVSGAEFRILGEVSRDPAMLELFRQDVDIHRRVASIALGIPEDQVTKEQRYNAKSLVFGLMYGRGLKSVAKELKISEQEAAKFKKTFFSLCPGAEIWIKNHIRQIKRDKYVVSIFGRVRMLPNIDSDNEGIAAAALREGLNTPIQGPASDYVLVALISIYNELIAQGIDAIPLITVYDSIIVECWEDEAQQVYNIMDHYMTRPIGPVSHVPMKSEIVVVDRWSGNKLPLAA